MDDTLSEEEEGQSHRIKLSRPKVGIDVVSDAYLFLTDDYRRFYYHAACRVLLLLPHHPGSAASRPLQLSLDHLVYCR